MDSKHGVLLLEVMGRDAGWMALHAGLAAKDYARSASGKGPREDGAETSTSTRAASTRKKPVKQTPVKT